jgi:undecaprenyl-diphosphatase
MFIAPLRSWRLPELSPRREDVIATAATLAAFLAFLISVLADGGLTGIDDPVLDWFVDHANATAVDVLRLIPYLGAVEVLIPTGMFMSWLVCRWYRSWWPAFVMSAAYVGAIVSATYLKAAVHRPEPFDLPGDVGASFPSGHTTQTSAVWLLLAILVVLKLQANGRSHWAAWMAPAIAVAANFAVGFAMVYRSSHWLTDMLGGYALGGFWVANTLLWARPEVLRAAGRYGRESAAAPPRRSPG